MSEQSFITIKGAREHNLKNIDVVLPRDRLVVITGPSGSGKSSLAFDTIYAEGQRRYVESLSAYARQFLEQMDKPDVDAIEGLSPAISIEQKTASRNPRSTVGTVTEIYDYLRLLFARVGHPFCFRCGQEITAQTVQQMVDSVMALPHDSNSKCLVLAPIVRRRKGEYRKELIEMRRQGFVRVRIDGVLHDLSNDIALDKKRMHTIEVVVDRLVLKSDQADRLRHRLADSMEIAKNLTGGLVGIHLDNATDFLFSEALACVKCNVSYPELSPRFFSFNSPYGACPACDGLGLSPTSAVKAELPDDLGAPDGRRYDEFLQCQTCSGRRLRPESLAIRIGNLNIAEVCRFSVRDAEEYFQRLNLTERETVIARNILKEVRERLGFLINVGLDYLTLDRAAATLSGGEGQRIRLATQIGSRLVGVLYILDEPSIGLHHRDNRRLLATLRELQKLGNTVVVVEHDADTIRTADYVLDMGPGAGVHGGTIVASGTPFEIMDNTSSLTGRYLSGTHTVSLPLRQRHATRYLTVEGAFTHNLKDVTARIPLGLFTCVTGVSGSGKSSLIFDVLYRSIIQTLYRRNGKRRVLKSAKKPQRLSGCRALTGIEHIDKVINITQDPIGRTPRSNPATYTGLFTYIREFFAQLPDSRIRGYRAGRYSFNVKGGRCEACHGDGLLKIEMHFLPDLFVKCEICDGRRYNRETLDVRHQGRNIADVLNLTVDEGIESFQHLPLIRRKLETLRDVGLGYMRLGQSATTLSGGEAQRVKLSRELSKRSTGRTLYILDEPTTGLHFVDIQKLLDVLDRLVSEGNSVVVIEHNLDIIRHADYIIDLGPEGGDRGGEIIATGSPEEITAIQHSHTGRALLEAGMGTHPRRFTTEPARHQRSMSWA